MILRLTAIGLFCYTLVIAAALLLGNVVGGRQMIYAASVNGNSDIFVLDVNRRLVHNLTRHAGDDMRPLWSPTGQQVVFESWRNGTRGVYVMNADGSDSHRISADAEASEYDPQWSNDGKTIVFRSYLRGRNSTYTYRIRPDGTGLQAIESITHPNTESRTIAPQFINGTWGTYVIEGDETRQIVGEALFWRETPQWSPDDRWIAFLAEGPLNESEVIILTADGMLMEQITTDGIPKSHLRWRP